MHIPRPAFAALGLGLLALGCQSSAGPAAPTQQPTLPTAQAGSIADNVGALGVYDYAIDLQAKTIALTPVRSTQAVGDSYTLDLTSAFSTAQFGCPSCLSADSVDIEPAGSDFKLTVGFTAAHPFPTPDGAGRKDLHVNNVRLVLLADGAASFYGDGADAAVTGEVDLVANADGYTALPTGFVTRPVGTTANLFPFVLFQTGDNMVSPTGNFDAVNGWNDNLQDPQGYNVLRMGGSASTSLELIVPAGGSSELRGRLALLGNFIVSAANKAARISPSYYMPEGAMPEAWHVDAVVPTNFVSSGSAQVENVVVEVADWQHGAAIDPNFPDPINPAQLKSSSDVASVEIDIPGFSPATAFGPASAPTGGLGTPGDPLLFAVAVTKPAGLPAGDYAGLVKVTDTRTGATALQSDLVTPTTLTELATYQVITLTVSPSNLLPTCSGYVTTPASLTGIPAGTQVDLTFDFLNDPDGTITAVDVDWAYNGTSFNPTANRTSAGVLSQTVNANQTIAVRFTDNDGGQNDPSTCTIPVTVLAPLPTFGAIGPFLPSGFTPIGTDGGGASRLNNNDQRNPVATYGDNVYVVLRDGSSTAPSPNNGTFHSYLWRSADGGQTWGPTLQLTPAAAGGGSENFRYVSINTAADGTVLIAGIRNTNPQTAYFSRVLPGAGNTITIDPTATAVSLVGPTGFDPAVLTARFDCPVVGDPTNASLAYFSAADGLTPNFALRVLQITNANAGIVSFSRLGGAANGIAIGTGANSCFEPYVFAENNGDVHAICKVGTLNQLAYREWEKSTSLFRNGSFETLTTVGTNPSNPIAAIGPDDLPVIAYESTVAGNFDVTLIKATNATAPTFAGSPNVQAAAVATGDQRSSSLDVDATNNFVYVGYGDTRQAVESTTARMALFQSVWNASLTTRVFADIKLDDAGIGDNSNNFGNVNLIITQRGTPSAKRFLYFWQDGDVTVAGTPDILYRSAQ